MARATEEESEEKRMIETDKELGDACERVTFIGNCNLMRLIRDYAYTERITIKRAMHEILLDGLSIRLKEYEREGKTLLAHKRLEEEP